MTQIQIIRRWVNKAFYFPVETQNAILRETLVGFGITMLEKSTLPDETISAGLRESYGMAVSEINFLPLGNDSSAWVYRVRLEGGATYFLKVKKGVVYEPSVAVPHFLKDQGIAQVVAPLPTMIGQLWHGLDDFFLILYPFIDGSTGMDVGLSDSQWIEFGTVLKKIHSTQLSPELLRQVQKEAFALNPQWCGVVKMLQAKMKAGEFHDPLERELAAFWRERQQEIGRIVARAAALGRMLQRKSGEFILCHTDIHTANVLIDKDDKLFIVDWDQPILAPKERDLMFVVGAGQPIAFATTAEALFFRGYGTVEIDPVAIAYYRYEWVVQEIADFGERVFLTPDVGAETKQDAVRGFIRLFEPGDVVEEAYQSEAHLPPDLWSRSRG
jgi:spectinomycin phosphotransferase